MAGKQQPGVLPKFVICIWFRVYGMGFRVWVDVGYYSDIVTEIKFLKPLYSPPNSFSIFLSI